MRLLLLLPVEVENRLIGEIGSVQRELPVSQLLIPISCTWTMAAGVGPHVAWSSRRAAALAGSDAARALVWPNAGD